MTSRPRIQKSIAPLTVLIPVRNSEHWIGAALESLRLQTYQDFDVLIIDDKSTDDTLEIVKNAGLRSVRIVQGPGQGIGAALALGVELSESQFIARQDADDLSDKNRFEKQMRYMTLHSDCVVLGTWAKTIDEDGNNVGEIRFPENSSAIKLAMNLYCPFVHPSVVFNREAVLLAGNYRSGSSKVFSEDYDLWSRMLSLGSFHNLSEYLVSYRLNSQSVTGSNVNLVNRSGSSIAIRTIESTLGESLTPSDRHLFTLFFSRHRRISFNEALRLYRIQLRIAGVATLNDTWKVFGWKRWLLPLVWIARSPSETEPLWEDAESIQTEGA